MFEFDITGAFGLRGARGVGCYLLLHHNDGEVFRSHSTHVVYVVVHVAVVKHSMVCI